MRTNLNFEIEREEQRIRFYKKVLKRTESLLHEAMENGDLETVERKAGFIVAVFSRLDASKRHIKQMENRKLFERLKELSTDC